LKSPVGKPHKRLGMGNVREIPHADFFRRLRSDGDGIGQESNGPKNNPISFYKFMTNLALSLY